MGIKETSRIRLEVDGTTIDTTFHDKNDAWEKAMNRLMDGARRAVITETVEIVKQ
jgi:hypothetical protein